MLRSLRAISVLLAIGGPFTLPLAIGQETEEAESTEQAQDEGQEGTPPVLPETEVEAAPDVPAPTGDGEFDLGAGDGGGDGDFEGDYTGDVFDEPLGGVFESPPVEGYAAESSTTGSIINIPDADLPATVNVIPRDVLDDQIVLDMDDVIRNAGGVTQAGDALFADRIFIRGLEVGSRNYRKDGFLDPTFVPRDFQNVERVEILKGPASVLYGAGDPAGLVNVITKKPFDAQFADFGFTFGSFERTRYTLDANGYAVQSGALLYRLNVAHEDAESFVDFDHLSRTQIAPAVTWTMGENTTLSYVGEWHRHNTKGFQGTPAVNGDPLFLPSNRFVGEPFNDFLRTEELRQSLVLRHELAECWWVSLGANSLFYQFPGSTTAAAQQVFPNPPLFVRSRSDFTDDEQSQSVIGNLAGEFDALGLHHRALAGIEYNYFDSAAVFESSVIFTPFNVADPDYANPPAFPVFTAEFPVFRQQRLGIYLQDLVDITEKVKLLGGVRFDTVDFRFQRNLGFGDFVTDQTFDNVSPRAGVVYQPWGDEVWSLYYSYSQSFTPPGAGIYLNGDLRPILGDLHEAGMKVEVVEDLYLTACGFHTVRRNDAFNDRDITLIQVGEVRSQGFEMNLVGAITERWSAICNYTYCDARLEDPNPLYNNNRARNVPFNTGNFWSRYNLYQDCTQQFGAALGLVALGQRAADLENDLFLPGFGRWDAGLFYCRGQASANVFFENLFDVQYAAASINENQIFQGAPFNVRATVSYLY